MNRRALVCGIAASIAFPLLAPGRAHAHAEGFADDVGWFVDQLAARYAYLPERHLDLARLRVLHSPAAAAAKDRQAFLPVLEQIVAELHDHHITINSNNDLSPQLVPTGTELWGEVRGRHAFITAVRPGSGAEQAGIRAGDQVLAIGGQPFASFLAERRPRALKRSDPEADSFVLRTGLAGNHVDERTFELRTRSGGSRTIALPPYQPPQTDQTLATQDLGDGLWAIRIENSLGEDALVPAFDSALKTVRSANGLILDLRNTPSGGSSDIAEPILGRFVTGEHGYQRVFTPGRGKSFPRDSWVKSVRGRGPFTYEGALVVLCDRWTGSMGEGMVIGLDALGRSTTVGTRMAGLCGGTDGFTLPGSGYSVHVPVERLYHLDGTARERWAPRKLVDLETASGTDPVMARGVEVLRTLSRT